MFFLFLESLGTTELLVILVVALVLFGPRKLPEMTRKFGKSLNEFKRAGDEFKQTWEREVAMESIEREAAIDRAMVGEAPAAAEPARDITAAAYAPVQGANIARGARGAPTAAAAATTTEEGDGDVDAGVEATDETAGQQQPSRKTDWL